MKIIEENTVNAWVSLVRAHRIAFSSVERALKQQGFPPLEWYDALLELRRQPQGLRLQELEKHMLLPQYNISRLADRLEKDSLIKKQTDPSDGRSRILIITDKGHALLKAMWPVYAQAIENAISTKLSKAETIALTELLRKVIS